MNFSPKCLLGSNVVTVCEMLSFSSLGHDGTNIELPTRPWFQDSFPNLIDHQIWKDRGKTNQDPRRPYPFQESLPPLLLAFGRSLIKGIGHINDQSCRCSWQCGFLLLFLFHLRRQHEGSGTITRRIRSYRLYGKFRQQLHGIIGQPCISEILQ